MAALPGRSLRSRLSLPKAPISATALAGLLILTGLMQIGLARLEGPLTGPHSRALSGDEKRYVEVASAWASGEPAELDPLWPPGYPAIVAAVLRAGGSVQWVVGLQILALFGAAVALAGVAREAGARPWIAWLAGALLLIEPEVAAFGRLFRPEALHLALALLALLLVQRSTGSSGDDLQAPGLVLVGAVLALAIALKSLLLPLVPLLLWPVVMRPGQPAGARRRVARGILVTLPLVLVLAPVAVWEHAQSGSWTLGSSARFNLWVGLNDRSPRSLEDDRAWGEYLRYRAGGATFADRQAALATRLSDLVRSRGLPALVAGQFPRQYFRLFDRESYFSAMLPPAGSRFLAGEGYREAPRWLARLFGGLELTLYVALLLAAPFGLVRLIREGRPGARWLALLLAYQLALFYFLHVKARYRLTLLPILILGAVWTVEKLWRRNSASDPPVSAFDLVLGTAGAAMLLFFAFGAPQGPD